ncbi:Kin [Symbiodinium microadriaticum]|nr:Kin [Symbiodinium microadriaticum]
MTKAGGFMTPKAISNRIKAKGLQKLRWYCQMCQKQCRDENGFRCHMKSEGHLRAMRVFADNPGKALSEFSGLFLKGFLDTLSHRHGTKRVLANTVYQEYIADKDHIHMNSTAWSSLGGLCRFLGREGKAVVDETEKGWYISYIDKDPNKIAKQALMEGRQRADLDEEERMRKLIEKQIAAAGGDVNGDMDDDNEEGERELKRDDGEEKIQVSLLSGAPRRARTLDVFAATSSSSSSHRTSGGLPFDETAADAPCSSSGAMPPPGPSASSAPSSSGPVALMSSMEQLMKEEERRKSQQLQTIDRQERKDYWLHAGIAVKILNKRVGDGKYYKEKGVVDKVLDRYIGEVRLSDGVRLRLDQQDLETVIPKPGKQVVVVNGRGRGCRATLMRLNEDAFNCTIRIEEGTFAGREIDCVDYEDISKLANS